MKAIRPVFAGGIEQNYGGSESASPITTPVFAQKIVYLPDGERFIVGVLLNLYARCCAV
jgi:hypothetical protein